MNRTRTVTALQIFCLGFGLQGSFFQNSKAACAIAQTVAVPARGGTVQQAPLPVLYRHFLAYQIHLDRAANDIEKRGKNGVDFRNYLQKKLCFPLSTTNCLECAAAPTELTWGWLEVAKRTQSRLASWTPAAAALCGDSVSLTSM